MKSLLDSQMIVLYSNGMVLMKIRNGCCGCWWYPDKLMSLLAIFKKATYLCWNLPWRCKRNALVFATSCSLLISFCWSSLNKENVFWFFCRESLKTQELIKKCQKLLFQQPQIRVWFGIFSNFEKPIRYLESWVGSIRKICHQKKLLIFGRKGKSSLKTNFF